MEIILYGLLIYLAYLAIKWLIVNVIAPVGKWAIIILAAAGMIIGTVSALKSYVKSIVININPYKFYEDKSKNKQEFAKRRSYFFGPGYLQLRKTVADAWTGISASVVKVGKMRKSIAECLDVFILKQILWLFSWIFYLCALIAVALLGGLITCVLSIIHASILIAVMTVIYVLFSITWLIDRIYLQAHSIKSSCPYCQVRSVIPMFQCPNCGSMHSKLVPGPYGIWHRRCTCGERLPTTFLLGRSKLKAFCPACGNELAASDVQQFAITVVGGTSSGKTVLLSAFYHEFFKAIDKNKNVTYTIPDIHADMFRNLESWFEGAECGATALGETSDMYSVLLKSNAFDVDKQFSLYDIAGEAFEDSAMASMLPQKQMNDSDGIVIVIDPLSALAMRNDAKSEGNDTSNYSTAEVAAVISNFVTYLKTVLTNNKIKVKSDKPVAVVITKTDLSSVSRRISYHRIKSIMRNDEDDFESFANARDTVSRDFLIDIGLQDAVRAIESGFANVHYFPVSAIGHAANGEEYEPEHVIEPFYWLIRTTQPALAELLNIADE